MAEHTGKRYPPLVTGKDFLLVHGGAHGAWCWERLIAALAERGHRGHALDFPGAGDDPTPRRTVSLDGCLEAAEVGADEIRAPTRYVLCRRDATFPPGLARRPRGVLSGRDGWVETAGILRLVLRGAFSSLRDQARASSSLARAVSGSGPPVATA